MWCKVRPKINAAVQSHAQYAPLVFVIYAPYPFQWFPVGIHGAPVSFVLELRIAWLSIARIHDKIPNIRGNQIKFNLISLNAPTQTQTHTHAQTI